MILFKDSVKIKKLTPALFHIIETLYNMNAELIPDYPVDWTITSINDSTHKEGSQHYKDTAIDLRSKNFNNRIKIQFRDHLIDRLGRGKFTILFESQGTVNEHYHIQIIKGQTYP